MPTFQDVREISLALPEVEEHVKFRGLVPG
jgi:hypothetical protein